MLRAEKVRACGGRATLMVIELPFHLESNIAFATRNHLSSGLDPQLELN